MKFNSKIILFVSFLIVQTTLVAQDNNQNEKNSYTLSDTIKGIEYYEQAKIFLDKAKYDSSLISFKKVITIYESLSEIYDEQKLWLKYIQAKNYSGYILCYLGRYDESIKYLNDAHNLCLEKLGENNLTAGQIYQSKGIYYDFTGNLNKSLEMFQRALAIRLKLQGENHSDVADTYNSIGIIYSKRSNSDKALEYFTKSLEIKKKILGDEHSHTAAAYNNIGIIYFDRGDYGKALEYYHKALGTRLKTIGEQHHLTASSYNNIGNCYLNMGEYDKAEENHLKSLAIRKSIFGDNHNLVATSYNNLGLTYWKKKNLSKALEYFNLALELRLKKFSNNHSSIAQSYMNIGLIYNDREEYDKAIWQYNKALEVWKNIGESKMTEISKIYQNLSEAYYGKQNYDSALIAIQNSMKAAVLDFNDDDIDSNPELNIILSEVQLLNAFKIKSKTFLELASKNNSNKEMQTEYLIKSLSVMYLADSLIDRMISGFKSEDSKYFLGEKASSIYGLGIESSYKLYKLTGNNIYKEKVFYFIEKSKAAVLQRGILDSKAKHFANMPNEILDKEKLLKDDLLFYDTQLKMEMQKKDKQDSLIIYNYQNKVFELKNEYENLIAQIEQDYPAYYDLKYKAKVYSVTEIQNVLSINSIIANYFVGNESIYIVTISRDSFDITTVNKPKDFVEIAKNFYTSILKAETNTYIRLTNKLSDIIYTPVQKVIAGKDNLVIIPDDVLYKIPFEALFTKLQKISTKDFSKLDYLIKDYNIFYHYSVNLFVNSLVDDSIKTTKQKITKNFVGFAPVFAKNKSVGYTISNQQHQGLLAQNDELVRSVSVDGKTFNELKYSEWEVNSIAALFNKNNPAKLNTAYFYSDAKEDSFKANVKDYRIVHIASHSFMNEDQPDISGVVFAQPNDSVFTNDGVLYASETYNLNLNADLVVLSSCESGLGKLFKGEGMIALNRGFLYSGTSNIVYSLWKVSDKNASELMVEFYRQMIGGKNYSESLRKAKLKLINNEITSRPRSWAGFLLIGNNQ